MHAPTAIASDDGACPDFSLGFSTAPLAAHGVGLWSNGGVFVRVWEYEVPDDQAVVFTVANAPDGAWGQLFGRAAGFLGTELYRDRRGDRSRALDAHR